MRVTHRVMNTDDIKAEVEKGLSKLTGLADEVKVQLHLASLDAKKEWDETLSPKLFEVEQSAKSLGESSRETVNDLVSRVEDFLGRLKPGAKGDTETKSH